jgi:CheY-like chemotaxis protein
LHSSPLFVHGDKARLTQVVANLLNNAAKYTPRNGEIHLILEQDKGEAVIRVRDNGIGIDPADIPNVFEMFAQISGSQQNEDGSGLGIGLNIVQRLVHMHKGRINGYSEGLGKGCEFTVRLPLARVQATALPQPAPSTKAVSSAPSRVLVVDDNQDAAFSMSLILRKQGHTVEIAHDGVEAVTKAEHFLPKVIFMDIGMPRMNGYEACKAMREAPWGKDIHIVALSGWGQAEDRKRSDEAGFDEHIVKPIDRNTLVRLMNEPPRSVWPKEIS